MEIFSILIAVVTKLCSWSKCKTTPTLKKGTFLYKLYFNKTQTSLIKSMNNDEEVIEKQITDVQEKREILE